MAATERVLAVIPARLASQRLPEKPLRDIAGQTLLERVWRRGRMAEKITKLVIATDSDQIAELARGFGAEVYMTPESITTGSQRVAATAELLNEERWTAVVNLQGDMPFISPQLIDGCISFHLANRNRFAMSTVATPVVSEEVYRSASDVKVVVSRDSTALYFSRAPVPHSRDGERLSWNGPGGAQAVFGYKHFGLYVFSPEALAEYRQAELSPLENVEKLEQLRLLELGYRIGVCVVAPELTANSVEVDTPGDLERAEAIAKRS